MNLVALAQSAKDADGVLDVGLAHHHRLEPALQGRVFFYVLAVFVERGGPDSAQLASGECRLEQVGGINGALRGAGADEGMKLVDEQDHLAVGAFDLLEHCLEPVLKLAAELRACDEGSQIERDDPLTLEALGHVPFCNSLRETFGDSGLADAGFADKDWIVLGPAREDLNHAPDFLIPADDGIELALSGELGQVAAILLESLVLGLRVLIGDSLAAADLAQRLQQRVMGRAHVFQCFVIRERQHQVLG